MKHLFTALLLAASASAAALDYNQVSLQAEARRDIPNDLARAVLFVEFSDPNPANLADRLNRAASDGFRVAKAYPNVKAESAGTTTYPLYNRNNRAEGWRGRAEIRVESTDFKALGELLGKLQASMQLGQVSFGVAPASRDRAEDALTDEAIQAFRQRALRLQQSLGGKGYRIVALNVGTQGQYAPPPVFAMRAMAAPAAEVAAPPMEGGQTQVTVTVQGTIQID